MTIISSPLIYWQHVKNIYFFIYLILLPFQTWEKIVFLQNGLQKFANLSIFHCIYMGIIEAPQRNYCYTVWVIGVVSTYIDVISPDDYENKIETLVGDQILWIPWPN